MKLFAIKSHNKISKTTILVRTIQCFEESGSVRNRPKSDKSITNEHKALDVLQFLSKIFILL